MILIRLQGWFTDENMSPEGKRQAARQASMAMLFILVVFAMSMVHLWEGRLINCLLALGLVLALTNLLVALRLQRRMTIALRSVSGMLILVLLYGVATGSDHGVGWLWLLVFPPAALLLLGRREGGWLLGLSLPLIALIMFGVPGSYRYSPDAAVRFLVIYCIIAALSFVYGELSSRALRALRRERDEVRLAINDLQQLSGLLPICRMCKKIRDDGGYWQQLESYMKNHAELQFSHGICPDCADIFYADLTADEATGKRPQSD